MTKRLPKRYEEIIEKNGEPNRIYVREIATGKLVTRNIAMGAKKPMDRHGYQMARYGRHFA